MPKPDILVTGASGFVGRHLLPALERAGCRVCAFSLDDGDIARSPLPFTGVARVFHLAARMFVPESWNDPRSYYETNVLGAVNVLEWCRRERAAITLVSSYVYGHPRCLPISEDHPLDAFNPYGHTKLLAEDVARFYQRHFAVPVTIVRPFNLYGLGQDPRFLIPSLVRQVLDPAQPEIRVADTRPRRDYLYIDDFVELLLATFNGPPGTYNAGSGRSVGIGDLVDVINRAAGLHKPVVCEGRPRPDEVLDVVADISHAAECLAWRPRVSLEEGIAAMLASAGPQ